MTYINIKSGHNGAVETIDMFETRKEARQMLIEYRRCAGCENAYLSNRATAEWRQDMQRGGHQ